MSILDIFRRKAEQTETRASGSGFTAEIMSARESYISGRRGLAELTATAQTCISMWSDALSAADVSGTDPADPARHGACGPVSGAQGRGSFPDHRPGPCPGVGLGSVNAGWPAACLSHVGL